MYAALDGVDDPEQKRRIIGRAVRRRLPARGGEASAHGTAPRWLAQGTIYPDVIESAGAQDEEGAHDQVAPQRRRPAGNAAPEAARAAARALQGRSARARAGARPAARDGVPPSVPGPGLGVRILGAVTREHADLLRRADAIFIDELRLARDGDGKSWYDHIGAGVRGLPAGRARSA